MAERQYPVARVRLFEPGRRHVQRYDGFGRYDTAATLWRTGRVTCSHVAPSSIGVGAGVGNQVEVATAMLLDHPDLNVVICRPFLDTTQSLGFGHFDFYGGQWEALPGLGMGDEVRLYQYDGTGTAPTGAVSRFTLPRNPVFCVSLQRAGPAPTHDWVANPPRTEIQFGLGSAQEWSLVLPYGGSAFVMRRSGGTWRRVMSTGRGPRLRNLEGHGSGERLLLWIGVWRGRLVVSTDGFVEDLWVCPGDGEPVTVPSGKMAVWHNAGQWAFSFIPIKMVRATLDSMPIDAGYDTQACSGRTYLQGRTEPVRDDQGAVLAHVDLLDTTGLRPELSPSERSWQAVITPYVSQQANPAFTTCVSPELHGVNIGQYAEIVDTGAQSWEEISDDVESAEANADNEGRAAVCRLQLDNALGKYADAEEYRRCSVELGWMRTDGSAEYEPVIDGYLVEPEPAVLYGPKDQMEAVVIDRMVRLRDELCDGRAPVFDGWPVREVFEWVLDRCGIPDSLRALEDTGTVLSAGAFDRPLWQVEPGRSWAEFLQEVAEFDFRAGMYFDVDGTFVKACRHCRQLRTPVDVAQHDGTAEGACDTTVRWELFTRSQYAGAQGLSGAIVSLKRPRRSLHSSSFRNFVAVCGLGPDGVPVRSVKWEPASLYDPASRAFVGWRKMTVKALETYTSQVETNRLAEELLRDGCRTPEHIVLVTPLEPGMKVGHVLRVRGGERVGTHGCVYRIESITHHARRRPGGLATTTCVARWIEGGS